MIASARAPRGGQDGTQSKERAEGGLISVTMQGAQTHIRPTGRLDDDMADTIIRLIASARAAGTEPVLDVSSLAIADRRAAQALVGVRPASVA